MPTWPLVHSCRYTRTSMPPRQLYSRYNKQQPLLDTLINSHAGSPDPSSYCTDNNVNMHADNVTSQCMHPRQTVPQAPSRHGDDTCIFIQLLTWHGLQSGVPSHRDWSGTAPTRGHCAMTLSVSAFLMRSSQCYGHVYRPPVGQTNPKKQGRTAVASTAKESYL
jgi:hypothetical protein